MKFAGVELTEESIQKAREWYADNARECIMNVLWRFNSKKKLVDAGMIEGPKPNKEDIKEVIL